MSLKSKMEDEMKIRRFSVLILTLLVLSVLAYAPERKVRAVDPACTSQYDSCNASCQARARDVPEVMQCLNACDEQYDQCLQGH